MSIFIILVLCFVYGYCSALERATDPMESAGGFDDNYYDSNHRRANPDYRLRHYSSRVWDLSKFK